MDLDALSGNTSAVDGRILVSNRNATLSAYANGVDTARRRVDGIPRGDCHVSPERRPPEYILTLISNMRRWRIRDVYEGIVKVRFQ